MRPPPNLTDPAALALLARMTLQPWALLRSDPAPGVVNMQVDEALLAAAAADDALPTLRFYSWEPTAVSLGRFQELASINGSYARSRGWDVVRRPTGGRGVLHQHEVTYSVVLPASVVAGAGVRTSYSVLVGALNAGLRALLGTTGGELGPDRTPRCTVVGRPANCFALASECDTLVPGGKLVGSAQVRRNGALLQHGSVLLDVEPEAWQAVFGDVGHPVSLRQLLGSRPGNAEVEEALMAGFAAWGIHAVTKSTASTALGSPGVKGKRDPKNV